MPKSRIGPITLLLLLASCTQSTIEPVGTPLERLRDGNTRFVAGAPRHPHLTAATLRDTSEHGQHPFATIVACSDSRVPVELLFDQGVGDLFVIRVAGNVIGVDETGSVEYAIEHLDTPIVVLLGHEQCGAVTAAVEGGQDTPCIMELLRHIKPAVDATRPDEGGPGEGGPDASTWVAQAVRENARQGVRDLLRSSEIARERVEHGDLQIVPAVYDITCGEIEWLDQETESATRHARNLVSK